ncbi:Holin [Ruminococcaceae bacterium BL-6]|nr:Holin [Ruminococcaceae bacterium BL-6]HBC26136.1 holin [Oscillospiraceae bacterium]HBN80123.1 holin [Oscillospiraceae bacterium]
MEFLEYLVDKALILIPVLNILGAIIKDSDKIPDKYIPVILLAFGILGSVGLMGFSAASVVQGVLVTGAAVYGNQIVKQFRKCE